MVKNIGNLDKIIRLTLGIILLIAAFYFKSGLLAIFGVFSIFEAISGWCVFYQIIGRNTCPVKNKNAEKIPFITLFISGISIFLVAVLLNVIGNFMGFYNWYDIIKNLSLIYEAKIDNLIFLIIIYPFALGFTAYQVIKLLKDR